MTGRLQPGHGAGVRTVPHIDRQRSRHQHRPQPAARRCVRDHRPTAPSPTSSLRPHSPAFTAEPPPAPPLACVHTAPRSPRNRPHPPRSAAPGNVVGQSLPATPATPIGDVAGVADRPARAVSAAKPRNHGALPPTASARPADADRAATGARTARLIRHALHTHARLSTGSDRTIHLPIGSDHPIRANRAKKWSELIGGWPQWPGRMVARRGRPVGGVADRSRDPTPP